MTSLEQLATLVGIKSVVPTTDGQEQSISDETRRALLKSMDIEAEDEEQVQASIKTIEESSWIRPLPPVVVLRRIAGKLLVPLTLEQGTANVQWTLTTDDQQQSAGTSSFIDLELLDARDVGGRTLERRSLPLTDYIADGYHDLSLEGVSVSCRLIVTPGSCWLPNVDREDRRLWGIAAQVYLLRSLKNWGIGDYSDLRQLVILAKEQGADIVGVNPLHAMFLDKPGDASPYSPSDRLLLNVLNIDVNVIPELAQSDEVRARIGSVEFQRQLSKCRDADLVDYEKVSQLKVPILRSLFDAFEQHGSAESKQELTSFHEERRDLLDRSCVYQAIRMYFAESDPAVSGPDDWPVDLQSSNAPGVEEFKRQNPDLIRFQLWLQWTADRQLRHASEAMEGMKVGLYRDLAVGSHASGAETWVHRELFAHGVYIGAPPDQFNPAGQNWGLPPLSPQAMRHDAFASFVDLLRANMRYARALRIDHVMALRRLYWIPEDGQTKDGAYVFYPIEDLVGIIALESHRNRCLVIGEDLGGVPEGFREQMAEASILSYRVLLFERGEQGFHAPEKYPYLALSVAGNHDLATLPGWWSGGDLDLRERLNLFPDPDGAQQAREMRQKDRAALIEALQRENLINDPSSIQPGDFCGAAHEFLARTQSLLTIVQLDDLVLEPEQVNVPGTSHENPNWRRKLSVSLEDLQKDGAISRLGDMMQ